MRWLSLVVIVLLCASTIPASSAGGDGIHWNGYTLDRNSIPNRVLIDHNSEPYSLQTGSSDVVIVAFIFTTCVDVCPVITNNLLQAEEQLDGIDYQFISITVDPATDTPETLKEYMEDYGATWPHLTGDLADLEVVWDDFMISVVTENITSHDHDHDDDSTDGEHDHMNHDNNTSSTVTVVMPDGNTSVNTVMPTGWDQLTASADQEGWTVNASESEWGHFVSAINDDEAPSDGSWWWELHSWNETNMVWEYSLTGIDSIETGNLAFAPNTTDDSTIPMPDMENETFVIVQSNGTNDSAIISQPNAWHMSLAALDSFDAPKSQWGHYMNSIEGVSAPTDYTWWWQLHYWDMMNNSWTESMDGMDILFNQNHIAWAPNSTMDNMIPVPSMEMDETMIHKLGVVYPDGTTALFSGEYTGMGMVNAMEHTMTTLMQNDIAHEMENGTISSIGGHEGEYDLYIWHDMGEYSHWMSTSDNANESILMEDADHYAWVAKDGDAATLMSPEMDEGHENQTSTSHSTQTFILDGDWNPKVVFTGYDWNIDDFVEDVERAANSASDPHDHDDHGLPGFTFATIAASLGLAIIATSRED